MNQYDHEDAFKDANLFAGSKTALADALKWCSDKDTARKIIEDAQRQHLNLFEAYIAGVEYGRLNPKEMK